MKTVIELRRIVAVRNAHLLTRRCYYNVFLSDGCINTLPIVIVVCIVSVVIALKENASQKTVNSKSS
jgi:hypothetical protein